MKRLSFALIIFACTSAAFGATRQDTVARSATAPRVSRAPQNTGTTNATQSTTRAVTSRSATTQQNTPPVARGRAAVQTPTTNARAAKQSVISTGTKVAAATENTAVDQVCWAKFSGCMDSFCMLDNANGGRCICSDKNAEYDAILQEIQNLDDQSYQLATVGVERIEMGDAVDAVMSKTDSVTKRVTADAAKSKRQSLDLSSWNSLDLDFDADAEDIFDFSSDGVSIANKTGDALYRAAAKLCSAQIPECKSQSTLMDLMYKQRVRSDCTAYENSLRAARTQSAQKLYAAQSAMREAALEQYRNANKYDLGQCTVQFKQCMQTTGGCGDDFTGCVDLAARANSMVGLTGNTTTRKEKTIKGTSSKIKISAETYDTLEAKKALCMTVTQECVNVRDQVWDAFLREAAPQIKSAELIVESNLRTSCISNISNCFQKACHDTMDPNDPEGSYDMCLTRPDTLRSVCKVEIDPCEAAEPAIMDYVRARLKSMRVDSCTNEFKACLQSEDRCGEDYTQCIGLDTDTIVDMCPAEKLTGCTYKYGSDTKTVKQTLADIATGIFLNIDNNMLTACQKAANAAMIKVCGSTENCNELIADNGLGSRSLEYKICEYYGNENNISINYNQCRPNIDMITDIELGRNSSDLVTGSDGNINYTPNTEKPFAGVIDGIIYWDSVTITNDGLISTSEYYDNLEQKDKDEENGHIAENNPQHGGDRQGNQTPNRPNGSSGSGSYGNGSGGMSNGILSGNGRRTDITEDQMHRINDELAALQTNIQNTINAIESDPKVQFCMSGREFQGYKEMLGAKGNKTRFPQLTAQMRRIISESALSQTKANYYAKYDELNAKMLKDYSKIAERKAEIAGQNSKDQRREIARQSCLYMADMSTLARSAEPPRSAGGIVIGSVMVVGGAVGAFFTGGATTPIAVAGMGLLSNELKTPSSANGDDKEPDRQPLVSSKKMNQWNYRETITTTFDWENLVCHKCVRSTPCEKTKNPLVGDKYCDLWGEETETCTDTQF
ncbi:MAG: hypothetical protein II179_03020 [Alphaproteobacteria bacterium]|nr:hypothetical protein [Alphaproteobacteria bacterium]